MIPMSSASLNLGCARTFPMLNSPYLGCCLALTEIVMEGVLVYVSLLFSVTLHPLPPPSLELISFSVHFNNVRQGWLHACTASVKPKTALSLAKMGFVLPIYNWTQAHSTRNFVSAASSASQKLVGKL